MLIITSHFQPIVGLQGGTVDMGILPVASGDGDEIGAQGQMNAAFETLPEEMADLQKAGMEGRLSPVNHDGMKTGPGEHLQESLQIRDFQEMGVVVEEAECAMVHAYTVHLEFQDLGSLPDNAA
jgi:hypothetical protein